MTFHKTTVQTIYGNLRATSPGKTTGGPRHRGTPPVAALVAVVAFALAMTAVDSTVSAQGAEGIMELSPERAAVQVAPISVAVQAMPPLEPLAFREEILQVPVLVGTTVTMELPPPALPRESLEDVAVLTGEQIFFNATLGGGSLNSVLGTINLFRVGEGPQFRLGYDHRSSDGFNGEEPGSGFFRQNNRIETWMRFGDGSPVQLEAEAVYRDTRLGLQQQRQFYSAEQRLLQGMASFEYRRTQSAVAGVTVGVEDHTRVLAVARTDPQEDPSRESPRDGVIRLAPAVWGSIEWPRLAITGTMDYLGLFPAGQDLDASSTVGLRVFLEGVPLEGLTMSAAGAARFRFEDGPYFPVEGQIMYRAAGMWHAGVSGGLRIHEQSIHTLWNSYPVARGDGTLDGLLPRQRTLFVQGEVGVPLFTPGIQARGVFYYGDHQNRLTVRNYDENDAVYPVSVAPMEEIRSEVSLEFRLPVNLQTSVGWTGQWSDRSVGEAEHAIQLNAEGQWGRFGTDFDVLLPITRGAPQLPAVGAVARMEIVREVELRLGVTDVLSPLETRGRTSRGIVPQGNDPFVEPGFEVTASVRVSF